MVYLDNASTTMPDKRVVKEMMKYYTEFYGNAGSVHSLGIKSAKAIDAARKQVASIINASPDKIIFTSGGTEANNMAMNISDVNIVSAFEHDSIMNKLGVNDLKFKNHTELLFNTQYDCTKTCTISEMLVNNELGIKNNVISTCKIAKANEIRFHTDCVQALGHEEIDVSTINCDSLSMSSHKIHGPKGVGALYIKDINDITPLIIGGEAQEFGIRGGTENVPGIVGFGLACQIAMDEFYKNKMAISSVRSAFLNELGANYFLNYDNPDSKIASIRFDGVDAETLVLMLSSRGIMVSSGSACRNHDAEPNKTLLAYGLSPVQARETVRVSFSKYNSVSEVVYAASVINECVAAIRSM